MTVYSVYRTGTVTESNEVVENSIRGYFKTEKKAISYLKRLGTGHHIERNTRQHVSGRVYDYVFDEDYGSKHYEDVASLAHQIRGKLKSGQDVKLDNSGYLAEQNSEDFRTATVQFIAGSDWKSGWYIWFNEKLVHSSKTFNSFERKLDAICKKWKLEISLNSNH